MNSQQKREQVYNVDPNNKLPAEEYYQKPQQNRNNLAIILILIGLLWFVLALSGQGSLFGFGASNQSENFASSSAVVLDLGAGDLMVEVEDRNDIVVEVQQRGFWGGNALIADHNSSELSIQNDLGFCLGNCSVSYRVSMPANLPLEVRTSSGEVMLSGELGSTLVRTDSGDIAIHNSIAELELQSASGYIEIEDSQASIHAATSSGDIRVNSARAERIELSSKSGYVELNDVKAQVVQVQSTSGDIDVDASISQLDAETVSGNIEVINDGSQQLNLHSTSGTIQYRGDLSGDSMIESTSGNVLVELDHAQDLTLRLNSRSGSVDTNLTLDIDKASEYELQGRVGNGSVHLTVNTTSGDIEVMD